MVKNILQGGPLQRGQITTTLAPKIAIYNPDKSALDYKANTTLGGDVSYSFGAQPNTRYYVCVYSYNGFGGYALTVRPQ